MIIRILIAGIAGSILLVGNGCGADLQTGLDFARSGLHANQQTPATVSVDTIPPKKPQTTGSVGVDDEILKSGAPVNTTTTADLNYLMGKFDPGRRPDFVAVGKPYTNKPGMLLRKEAFAAFKKMWLAAKKDGVLLSIISSTRNFEQQKTIWEGKWSRFAAQNPLPENRALKILEYSAMPGASRHHWGTDIDLNDLNNTSFEGTGKYAKVYQWLSNHAHEYGFCQPYSPKNEQRDQGYNEEKWHWSYMPLARHLLQQYSQSVRDDMFAGFAGAETAKKLHIVEHYALGINRACIGQD